jgi:cobalamin biosynthesis protein CobT
MTTRAIQVLETASEKVARMMTATGVTVQFHPKCTVPCADPETLSIVLPPLPEKLTEEEEMKLRGALDHEVAHILFSKNKDGKPENLGKLGGTLAGYLFNIVEDGRVNRLIAEKFMGAGENILVEERMIFRHHAAEVATKRPTLSEKDRVNLERWIAVMRAVEKYVFRSGEDVTTPLGPSRFDATLPASLKARLEAVATLEDAKECADPIKVWLFGNPDEAKKTKSDARKDAGKTKSDKRGSGSGKPDPSKGFEEPEKDAKEEAGDNKAVEEEKKEAGGKNKEEKKEKPEAKSDLEDGEGFEEKDTDRDGELFGEDDEENVGALVAVMMEGEADKAEFLEISVDAFRGETRYYVDTSTDAEVHVRDVAKYSWRDGMIDPEALIEGKRLFSGLVDKVAALRGRLIMDLQSIGRKWERHLETGILDTRALHRPFVGDPRMFANRVKREKIHTAVTLLQDCSSSMHGKKFNTSIQLAALFCDALEMANVPCEVLGFTTHYNARPTFGIRHESLLHVVFKSFQERAWSHRNDWYAMNDLLGQNVDGEGVLWAAKRLVVRPERRKVLFVLSDGIPMAMVDGRGTGGVYILHSHLRESVRAAELAGIEVIGVGIRTDAPRYFYRKHVVYDSLGDLMTGFYSGVASLLRGGPGLPMAV